MKACVTSHRSHTFQDGSVIESCPADEACDAKLAKKRRALLCPGTPLFREPARVIVKPSPFAFVMLNDDEEEQPRPVITAEPSDDAGDADAEAEVDVDETELESEYDLGDGEDADEPDEQDDYEA